jgi:hypothetical protein
MNEYIEQMDNRGFRRRYRMTKAGFWTLLDIIEKHLRLLERRGREEQFQMAPLARRPD